MMIPFDNAVRAHVGCCLKGGQAAGATFLLRSLDAGERCVVWFYFVREM